VHYGHKKDAASPASTSDSGGGPLVDGYRSHLLPFSNL
jgi:hypothetical protein